MVEGGEEYVSNVAGNEGNALRVTLDRSDESSDGGTDVESVKKLAADMMSAKLNLEDTEVIKKEDGPASSSPVGTSAADNTRDVTKLRKLAIHEVFALRLLATTKQRLSLLQALGSTDAEPSDNTEDTSENKE